MKKTVFTGFRFVPALLVAVTLGGTATAQKKASPATKSADSGLNVRIIEQNGHEVREIERTYRVDGMSDPDRDKLVMKLVDSLKATRKGSGQRKMTIIVDDVDSGRVASRDRMRLKKDRLQGDAYVFRGKGPQTDFDVWGNPSWRYEFHRGMDSMSNQLQRFKFQMPKDFDRQLARPFEDWSRNISGKASTIRGLEAYPNNPDRNQLNIRFTAPAKGDILVSVTNTKGKEVAKREIKDFSGEFVGQIDLGKQSQGTYFITVTQNEDGAVKRIVLE
jgi:hypothetical protein